MLRATAWCRRARLRVSSAAIGLAFPCQAAPLSVPITPANAHIGLTVYELSLFPRPGQFGRFVGSLVVDTAHPDLCQVRLAIDAASFTLADRVGTQAALGPLLLDVRHFPSMAFTGTCVGSTLTGMLTLHGVTRPLTLMTGRVDDTLTAKGSLRRGEFKVAGLAGLIGRQVEVDVQVTVSPAMAADRRPG